MSISLLFPGFVPTGNFGDVTQYQNGITAPKQLTQPVWTKGGISLPNATPCCSYWLIGQEPGAAGVAPSAAAAPTNATTGALDSLLTDSLNMWLAQMELRSSMSNDCALILCDRLSHQGGLSGTTTGAQTTNFPTAALTRYTTGVGVMAALEIYTTVGSTATTATVSYTNQAGTPGQVGPAVAFGGASQNLASRFLPLSLQSGDTGVRAVASVTLAASTVSAAGNFGVTLYKPLALFPVPAGQAGLTVMGGPSFWDALYNGCGNLPQIQSGACLFWVAMGINQQSISAAFAADPVIALA